MENEESTTVMGGQMRSATLVRSARTRADVYISSHIGTELTVAYAAVQHVWKAIGTMLY